MVIADAVKRLSYSPLIAAGVRRLGLRGAMQWAYAASRGNPGAVSFALNEVEAAFAERTPHELR
jgi:hypothetical protein